MKDSTPLFSTKGMTKQGYIKKFKSIFLVVFCAIGGVGLVAALVSSQSVTHHDPVFAWVGSMVLLSMFSAASGVVAGLFGALIWEFFKG